MKKLLLIAAMAAVALGASAGYTIEKLWSYDISSINASNARQGLGMNGKFYINDRTESKIYIYDQTGQIGTMTGSPNMTITRDEAGNIIYSNVAFPGNWGLGATINVVNPLTEETKVYQIPEECGELGRCDVLGIAKGNMMENGELYITSNTSGTTIAKLVITDGEVNTDESYNPDCGNVTTSTTTPIYAYTDLEGNDALLYYTRTTNPVKLLPDGDNYAGAAFGLPSRGSTMSVFPFVWDGKELFLYNYKPTGYGDYLDGVCVAEAGASQPIVSVLPTVTATLAPTLAINWLWAEVDADGVTIYQYYPSTNDTPGAHISVYRMTKTTDYTVASNILGNWTIDPANNMTLGEDGLYTLTVEDVEIPANYLIEYKVTSDGTWWPQDFNAEYLINEAGIYTLVFTFDPETGNVSLVATKTGNISYNGDVYILGDVNDNGGWFTNKGVQMTRDEENNVYTATITTTGEAYTDPETGIGYSYFSFTKQLAETADDWDAIDPYRFGADSDGDFWVTDETLGNEIALMNGGATFQIPAGQWNLTLSVDNMTLIIEKVVPAGMRGDVNNDQKVDITDATTLINYLLYGDATGINMTNANCDWQNDVDISDATTLINFLLYGTW